MMTLAKTYARGTGSKLSTVSKRFYGLTDFFDNFGHGRASCSIDKYSDVVDRFTAEWPEGVEWPILDPVIISRAPKKK